MKVIDIQKHVTHFSEQLRQEARHEQEVVVGGKITHIIPPVSNIDPMYIIVLDDVIGTIHVCVSEETMQSFSSQFHVGNYVFVEGLVNVVTRSIRNQIKKDVSVFAYNMKDITKVEDAE